MTADVEQTVRFLYESCGLRYDQVSDTAVRAALTSLVEQAEAHGWEGAVRDADQRLEARTESFARETKARTRQGHPLPDLGTIIPGLRAARETLAEMLGHDETEAL